MNKKQFLQKYNLTENQFTGKKEITGSLDLRSLTSIPEGFNPTVGGSLDLRSLTSIPEGFNPTVGGSLDLDSLTSIPEGFNPTVGGSLDLRSLTSIPEGFNPTVGGSLNLDSLTSIPEGFNPTVGGYLDLRSLTSIPDGFNPTVGGYLDLRSLTSIPDGFNPTVGGYLDLRSESKLIGSEINIFEWQKGKYISVDGIFCEVVSKKGNLYKCKKVNYDEFFFVVTDDNGIYAHGETLIQAKSDLIFKITKRDKSYYSSYDLDSNLNLDEAIVCYRVITGACSFGVNDFIKNRLKTKSKSFSIKEIINLTDGEYGHQEFKLFFTH